MQTSSNTQDLLTIQEVAELLGVHPQTVRLMIRRKEIGYVPIGTTNRHKRITHDQFQAFIDAHRNDVD